MGMECVFVRYILYSTSPTYVILTCILYWTLRKFLPAGANLKKSWKRILHPVGNKEQETIFYILFGTGTCLNLFIVHFEKHFCNFSAREIKKTELNLGKLQPT